MSEFGTDGLDEFVQSFRALDDVLKSLDRLTLPPHFYSEEWVADTVRRVRHKVAGIEGVKSAARELWPELPESAKYYPRAWCLCPDPLMTTTGYAMAWYPKANVVVYVDDWSDLAVKEES